MRLTVLGCWSPFPRTGGACSGYLVQAGGASIMLDAGNGAFSNLCRHLDYRKLDALVISHLHPDHHVDMYCLLHAVNWALLENTREKPLKIFLPREPRGVVSYLREKNAAEVITYEELPRTGYSPENGEAGGVFQAVVEGVLMEFLPVPHKLSCYAVSLKDDRNKIVYSGDCAPNNSLEKMAAGADIFLCECSGLDEQEEYLAGMHHTARQAGEAGKRAGVKRLILTHFWPENSLAETARQAGEGYGGPVELAEENITFEV